MGKVIILACDDNEENMLKGLFLRATSQVAMHAWIFGDCRKGCYVPVAHVLHRPKRSVDQIPTNFSSLRSAALQV